MAISLTRLERDLRSALNQRGMTFTFSGEEYTGIVSPIDSSLELHLGGDSEVAELSVVAVKADFDSLPEDRDVIQIEAVNYIVVSATSTPGLPGIELKLGRKPGGVK